MLADFGESSCHYHDGHKDGILPRLKIKDQLKKLNNHKNLQESRKWEFNKSITIKNYNYHEQKRHTF